MLCYLPGSENRSLTVHRAIEFVFLDDRSQSLELVCDFWIENTSIDESDASLIVIHRGNVELSDGTHELLERRNFQSEVAKTIFLEFDSRYALDVRKRRLSMAPACGPESIFQIVPEAGFTSFEGPNSTSYVPFVRAESAKIRYGEYRVLRIRGRLSLAALDTMLGDSSHIRVFGENRLVSLIAGHLRELRSSEEDFTAYEECFDDFRENQLIEARQYHFIVSAPNRRIYPISPDLKTGFEDRKIRGKRISWYWSMPTTTAPLGHGLSHRHEGNSSILMPLAMSAASVRLR